MYDFALLTSSMYIADRTRDNVYVRLQSNRSTACIRHVTGVDINHGNILIYGGRLDLPCELGNVTAMISDGDDVVHAS